MMRAITFGSLTAVVSAIPLAALCAAVYRFPVPFAGDARGLEDAPRAAGAAAFYGVFLGGFVVLAAIGAVMGGCASLMTTRGRTMEKSGWRDALLGILAGVVAALIVVGLFAANAELIFYG
jgi:hypothetical protein